MLEEGGFLSLQLFRFPGGDDSPARAQQLQSKVTTPKSDLSVAMGMLGMPPPPASSGREGKREGTVAEHSTEITLWPEVPSDGATNCILWNQAFSE